MAHHSTILPQLLKLAPRHEFEALARRFHKGRRLRSMTHWAQFAALALGRLLGRCSLHDVVANLAAQPKRLHHLGVGRVARSSLARVNAKQPHEMHGAQFARLLWRCRGKVPGHGFRFRHRLLSLDSTAVDLRLSMFPWVRFRRTKGAVKLHVGLDHGGFLPAFMRVTDGRASDIKAARALRLSAGTIADIYRSRWQVELFFKWIKQRLKVKSFVGTSRNAVLTQLRIAMCVHLLLSFLKFANWIAWSLHEILRILQLNLFDRRPVMDLLKPKPPAPSDRQPQLALKLA